MLLRLTVLRTVPARAMPIKGDNAEDCRRKTPHFDPDITQLTPISLIVVARVRYRCVMLTAKRLARCFNARLIAPAEVILH